MTDTLPVPGSHRPTGFAALGRGGHSGVRRATDLTPGQAHRADFGTRNRAAYQNSGRGCHVDGHRFGFGSPSTPRRPDPINRPGRPVD